MIRRLFSFAGALSLAAMLFGSAYLLCWGLVSFMCWEIVPPNYVVMRLFAVVGFLLAFSYACSDDAA